MVAEEDPSVGGVIILAVVEFVGGCDSRAVETCYSDGQESAIEAEGNGEDSQCADHDPESVGRLIHGRYQCCRENLSGLWMQENLISHKTLDEAIELIGNIFEMMC